MAKNIIDQFLSFVGLNGSDYDSTPIYLDECRTERSSDGLSSVERYQRRKNARLSNMTSVEKFLAKKQKEAETEAAKLAKRTGVEQYLLKKQQRELEKAEELANMTGVAKYLLNVEARRKLEKNKAAQQIEEAQKAKKEKEEKDTGVNKYLAKRSARATEITKVAEEKPIAKVDREKPKKAKPAAAKVEKKEPKNKEEQPKTKTETSVKTVESKEDVKPQVVETPPSQEEKTQVEEKVAESSDKTPAKTKEEDVAGLINLADNAAQCQGSTLKKGKRCRRKANLEIIERTIDGQNYRFAVCSQHNNDSFTPFADLLKKD